MAIFGASSSLQDSTDKRLFTNNRKPRVYANTNKPTPEYPYPLEFCIWMQNNFDEVIEYNTSVLSCNRHEFIPQYSAARPDFFVKVCKHCGFTVNDAFIG